MADNYLEKKMEEHRLGARPSRVRVTPSGAKPGFALLPYTVKTAFIKSDECSALLETVAKRIRETGCRVAISTTSDGNALAQKLACAYVPYKEDSLAMITSKWGEIEMLVNISADSINIEIGRGTSIISKADVTSSETYACKAADLCVYLSLPDSIGKVFGEFII